MPRRAPGALRRDVLVYGLGLALQRGLAFLLLPAATRILGPHAFGVASAALVMSSVLSSLCTFGVSYGVVRLYFDESADAERTEWAALVRAQLVLGGALAGIAWLLGPVWSHVYEHVGWSGALQAAVVLALAQAAGATTLAVLRAEGRVFAFAAVVAVQTVVGAVMGVVLAEEHGPGGLVGGLAIGAAVGALIGLVLTYRRPSWSRAALRSGLLLSIPFVAHMLASWVLSLSDRVLIERELGLERVATYQVAYAIALVPILLTDAVQTAWLPRYFGFDARVKRELPGRLLLRVTASVAALAALVVLLAPSLDGLLAPDDFGFPLTVIALVVSMTFVRAPYLLAFAVLSDAKRSRAVAVASGLGAVANVGLNLALLPVWGLEGAGVATLVAYGIMSLVALRYAERAMASALGLARLACCCIGAVGVVLALSTVPTDVAGWALRGVLAAGTTVALVILVRRTHDAYAALVAPATV